MQTNAIDQRGRGRGSVTYRPVMTLSAGLVLTGACQFRVDAAPLTLPGGLEIERLETPRQRRGVDHIHAIVAVVLSVEHDSHHQDGDGDDASAQARVQRHVVRAVHT